ncbi:MAG: hypothetical protein REI94_07390 [Moraxellaceae bacterium]|nr:hypothetical protein [Moraxellaceae bacterium]
MLVVIASFSAAWVAHGLRVASERTDIRAQRDTLRALRDAKLALIAHALSEDNTPGTLPCPTSDLDGSLDNSVPGCSNATTDVAGRLPWFKLGLMASRDGDGECLWYVVSAAYKNMGNVRDRGDSRDALNPVITSSLRLDGSVVTQPAALLIAPGRALGGQGALRGTATQYECVGGPASAFLDSDGTSNADGDAFYVTAVSTTAFNDTVMPISREELLRPVLRRVLVTLASDAPSPDATSPSIRDELQIRMGSLGNGTVADLRNASNSHQFDLRLHPLAESVSGSACPYDGTQKQAVSWLCFNGWYAFMDYSAMNQTITLSMDRTDPTAYACTMSVSTGAVRCGYGA